MTQTMRGTRKRRRGNGTNAGIFDRGWKGMDTDWEVTEFEHRNANEALATGETLPVAPIAA